MSGALPAGIVGGFGPDLQRFILALQIQGQVTTERLTALLNGMGVVISKRQVVRLLAKCAQKFVAEEAQVLRAGLATAPWITVDDTAARHARRDGYTTQIGDDRFTAFRTAASKSRANFLSILRAGSSLYVINAAALNYMRRRGLPEMTLAALERADPKEFADADAFAAHLEALGLTDRMVTPDPVALATEGALWGAIRRLGLLESTVVVSDGAGQFRVGDHAACWVHAERLVHKLIPVNAIQRRAVEVARQLIWWFYADLKAYRLAPHLKRAAAMRARFDRIFSRVTGFALLDQLLRRLSKQKADLLRVLDRPEIPLHTNGSENDIRAVVTKRKVSGGTVSEAGRQARDVLLGLMKTCRKLGVSFFEYLGCRLRVQGAIYPVARRPRPRRRTLIAREVAPLTIRRSSSPRALDALAQKWLPEPAEPSGGATPHFSFLEPIEGRHVYLCHSSRQLHFAASQLHNQPKNRVRDAPKIPVIFQRGHKSRTFGFSPGNPRLSGFLPGHQSTKIPLKAGTFTSTAPQCHDQLGNRVRAY